MDPKENIPKDFDSLKYECDKCNATVKDLYNHNYNIGKKFKRNGHFNQHMKKHNAQPTQCSIFAAFVLYMAESEKAKTFRIERFFTQKLSG